MDSSDGYDKGSAGTPSLGQRPEFVAKDLRKWLANTGPKTLYISIGTYLCDEEAATWLGLQVLGTHFTKNPAIPRCGLFPCIEKPKIR